MLTGRFWIISRWRLSGPGEVFFEFARAVLSSRRENGMLYLWCVEV